MEACEMYWKYNKDKDGELYEKFKNDKEINHAWTMGGRHRGSFTDRQQLLDIINRQNDPYGICEGYYEYLLIETHYINSIDGCMFEPDHKHETWFKFKDLGEGAYKYEQIERPECLTGTINFL